MYANANLRRTGAGVPRRLALVLTALWLTGWAAFAALPGDPRRNFDLPAGDAALTLARFSEISEKQLLYLVDEVRGVSTNPVRGVLAPREALERMLAHTTLAITADPTSDALMVNRRPAPLPTPGLIIGRVYNPATGEYVRNARIRLVSSGASTTSGLAGEYRLAPAGPGPETLEIAYTGYHTARATVEVPPGAKVVQNFDLVSALSSSPPGADEPVKLSALVVAGDREGAAKAIMDQRSSMNITSTVASDSFGDNPEGNIGEFMKHLPGVELDVFFGEVRTVRLGGLPSDYTSVTIDGMPLASVDAGTSGASNSRAFTMEMASLNSVESIELSRTIGADVDANAPAGTINLRTKRAFDRASRRVAWQANLTAHSGEFNLRRSLGPDEEGRRLKLRPGGIFEYSDAFWDRRLGVVLNVSESNVYQEAVVATFGYSPAASAADPRELVPSTLAYQWAPRINRRFSVTFATDAKLTPFLDAGLGVIYNWADLWTPQRNVVFNTGNRNGVLGGEPLLSFTSAANGSVQVNPVAVAKLGQTTTLLPRLTYKRNHLEIEARGSFSDSSSWYDPLGRRSSIRDFNGPSLGNITFQARRSSAMSADWRIVQTGGPDLGSGANYTSPALTLNDGRFGRTTLISGELAGSFKHTLGHTPVAWKAGVKTRHQTQKFEDDSLAWRADLIGTQPVGAWSTNASPWPYSLGMVGGGIVSSSGADVFLPNLYAIGRLYQESPSRFRQNWGTNATNYYESYVARRRRLTERVDAGFIMATTTQPGWTGRLGLRWEGTETEATEPTALAPSDVRAAGFPVGLNGIATSVAGLQHQFLSRPWATRTGRYANLFPSASLKVPVTRTLDAQLGFSSTIRRPSYANLAGAWLINEADLSVTAPNQQLKPETATNVTARLAYYFESVGQFSLTAAQLDVHDTIITNRISSQAFGYKGGDDFARYDFITSENGPDPFRVRSFALDYNQNFGFLGAKFKRLAVHGSYTRLASSVSRNGLTPHLASGGLGYTHPRFNLFADWNWTANSNRNNSGSVYRRHHANLDVGGGWRIARHYTLSVSARNILKAPWLDLQRFDSGGSALTRYETVGTSWTFALKANY